MPLTVSTDLQTILSGPVRTIQKTCAITFPTRPAIRVATAPVTVGGNDYAEDLRSVGDIRRTLENPVDRVPVQIQNVDRVIGQDMATYPNEWSKAEAVIGRLYTGSGETEWIELFRGIVQQPVSDDLVFRFDVVPDVIGKGAFIASRSLAALCAWRFKDPATCGYSGSETTCNHHLRSKAGCMGRDRELAFGGTEHKYNPDASAPGSGSNQSGSGGGGVIGCPTLEQFILTARGSIRVANLMVNDQLFDPIDGEYYSIRSLERLPDMPLVRAVSASGAESWSSDTHKLLWYREHVTGERITKFTEGDPVLCF